MGPHIRAGSVCVVGVTGKIRKTVAVNVTYVSATVSF